MAKKSNTRFPNLKSIIMVENILSIKKQPISIPELKKQLPKKIMHQTLKVILDYLWQSKKIEFTPSGIIWIFKKRGI